MLFHSVPFFAFLGATFALYWGLARWKAARLSVLLLASALFYASWSPLPLLMVAWYALVNWSVGQAMARLQGPGARKAVITLAVVHHVGVLASFKYLNLFLATAAQALQATGLALPLPEPVRLLMPVGLSFLTFTAIANVVDAYRGETDGTRPFLEHLLSLLFFPIVVSGPILRGRQLLERLAEPPRLTPEEGSAALFRMGLGVAKKILVADVLSAGLVDRVFANPGSFTSAECALATVAYSFQLYFDFSGYTDIAIGAAALFGFKLPENFDKPYHARNLFEFWNRWHMSLSTWLRDYLYRPLGGNRTSRPKALRNLMAVMVLGGLWHGADWRFAVWGTVHGLLLCSVRIWWWVRGKRPKEYGPVGTVLGVAATFATVALSRIVFRAPDVGHALAVVKQLALFTPGLANVQPLVWGGLALAVGSYVLPRQVLPGAVGLFTRLPVPLRAAAVVGLGLLLRQVASYEVQPYIYFQF